MQSAKYCGRVGQVTGFIVTVLLGVILLAAEARSEESSKPEFQSTHKQTQVIKPLIDGKPVSLNTFCLDQDGNILACVGGSVVQYVMNEDGSQQAKSINSPQQLQMYSADGTMLRATDLEFKPTAINVAPDGTIFVAGMGKVARVSKEGRVLSSADSPHVGDLETFRERIEEAAKKQVETNKERYKEQVARIDERIKVAEEKPESERTEVEQRRLTTYKQQKTLYEAQLASLDRSASVASGDAAVNRKLGITALAVTNRDIFVCAYAVEGSGYEVWRMTHEFSEPTKVVSQLSGCCGQCDIQANETNLILAENTKFKVALLDRDGKRQADFGKGDRKAVDGFGSCCNPMNVRCCDNGDIVTAESSVGAIKRFNKNGELIGVVGKAKIGGGCKHVAVAFDARRDRYYMMNVDKDHICVLVPNAEAGDSTPEEMIAKQAREGLGAKLVGAWVLAGVEDSGKPSDGAAKDDGVDSGILKDQSSRAEKTAVPLTRIQNVSPLVRSVVSDPYSSTYYQFDDDGALHTKGGAFRSDQSWECVRQEGSTLFVSQLSGGIQYLEYRVEFASDDEILLSVVQNERVLSSNRFRRSEPEIAPADSEAISTK